MHNRLNKVEQSFAFSSKRYCYSLLSEADRDFYRSLYSDKNVMEKIAEPLGVNSISTLFQHVLNQNKKGLINQSKSFSWTILDISTNLIVGIQGFIQNSTNQSEAEFGIMLLPGNHRKGIASEAICELIKYGFTELNFSKQYANYTIQNKPIQQIAENLGFNISSGRNQPNSQYCWLTKQEFVKRLNLFEG